MQIESTITAQYLAEIPLRQFHWVNEARHLDAKDCEKQHKCTDAECTKCEIHGQSHECWSEFCQQAILNETIDHSIGKRYPPSVAYRKAFLKIIINKVESLGYTVRDDVYSLYVKLLSEADGEFTYKSYFLSCSKQYVIMQESKNMISGGTTGLVSWKGGMLLAEWILNNRDTFSGSSLMELGSGCGFTGIAIMKAVSVTHYTFTDCHPSVLSLLRRNINNNCIQPDSYTVMEMTWGEVEPLKRMPDYILAADVVFDPELIPDLVASLCFLTTKSTRKRAYIASTERNPTTYKSFLRELEKRSLVYREIDTVLPQLFLYDRSKDIHLLELSVAGT